MIERFICLSFSVSTFLRGEEIHFKYFVELSVNSSTIFGWEYILVGLAFTLSLSHFHVHTFTHSLLLLHFYFHTFTFKIAFTVIVVTIFFKRRLYNFFHFEPQTLGGIPRQYYFWSKGWWYYLLGISSSFSVFQVLSQYFKYFHSAFSVIFGTIFGREEMMVRLAQGSLGWHLQD